MAHQFPAQHQMHPAQVPTQHQNIGQQRQAAPMAQPQVPTMGQQRGMQSQQSLQNPYANYDPQFALFTLERPKGADGWEDVEAEQQHVNAQDLQSDVKKFQRSKRSIKSVLNDIPSSNARRIINELVEDQNRELMALNRTLQWTIASIDIDWKIVKQSMGSRQRQLKRISVILQTGPSGYEDPQTIRAAAAMATKPQPMQPNQAFAHQPNHVGHEMPQPLRNPPHPAQPPMGHVQQPVQAMRVPPTPGQSQPGQAPPPPPPPPGMTHLPPPPPGATPLSHLPPPPPGAAHGMPRPPAHGQQQHRPMPGAFPDTVHRPAMRPGQPDIEILDSSFLKKQKKPKGRHEELSSESESNSDEWESETGDSGSDRFRVRHVEHGEFAHIGKLKRGRSRQSSRSKKSRHNKPHSKVRSRSRSHVRTETHRRRRDSDLIDPPPMGKYSPMSSKDNSPRSSKQQLPPIHIHMSTPAAEKPTRANERVRRDSHGASSPDYRKEKANAEPMSRVNSWDRHSGTASFNDNSSVHTADDSVFSEPDRHGRRSRHHSDIVDQSPKLRSRNLPHRQESFGHPHPSHIYGDVEPRTRRSAYPANDYPHDPRQREPYFDEHAFTPRPGLHRRNSAQTPQSNPFDTARYPPRLGRSNTFAPDMQEPIYGQREPRYLADRAAQDDVNMRELADALEHIREQKRRPLHGRRASEYERMGGYGGGYDMYDRRGY
ncbi:hypothetical protein BU25DRAFT_421854 [Macroventuria anomochaeta]|uniref:Uncharacterized protein n=1 Tax=Macroventuria anomochaeta TaxID=301207 RepID=A0ACB6S081_9PLEO|nr:uncharacterized protein BU25DRAFT_421854 [Macroventuria anomochaeta]KAF2627438.1 hypothetical protein BU25DRAFT_421854 [Macroventuria anomochaeta]